MITTSMCLFHRGKSMHFEGHIIMLSIPPFDAYFYMFMNISKMKYYVTWVTNCVTSHWEGKYGTPNRTAHRARKTTTRRNNQPRQKVRGPSRGYHRCCPKATRRRSPWL